MESGRAEVGPSGKVWGLPCDPDHLCESCDLGSAVVLPWTLRGQPSPPAMLLTAAFTLKFSLLAVEIFQDFRRGFLWCFLSFLLGFLPPGSRPRQGQLPEGLWVPPGQAAAFAGTSYPGLPLLQVGSLACWFRGAIAPPQGKRLFPEACCPSRN